VKSHSRTAHGHASKEACAGQSHWTGPVELLGELDAVLVSTAEQVRHVLAVRAVAADASTLELAHQQRQLAQEGGERNDGGDCTENVVWD
jgi:hypothetical protein